MSGQRAARRAFVTGATGFVGSHLTDLLLERGWTVTALVRPTSDVRRLQRPGVRTVVADLDADRLPQLMSGHDVVCHLAAATRARTEAEYQRVNVEGTRAVADAVARAAPRPRRLVYLSSMAAAGPSSGVRPVHEADAPHPITAYGRSKLAAERLCLERDEIDAIALRPPAVYGPRDRDLFTFFRFARWGIMPLPAGPDRPVQLIHVRDLARAIVTAAQARSDERLYHVADARSYAWTEVAGMIGAATGGRRPLNVRVPRPLIRGAAALSEAAAAALGRATIFNRDKARELLAAGWLCSTRRAERELGFRTQIDLESGLRETAQWYRRKGWLDG